jgi:hypothetical protein
MNLREVEERCSKARMIERPVFDNETVAAIDAGKMIVQTDLPEAIRLLRAAKHRIEIARYYMNNEGYVDMAEKMNEWLSEVQD